MVKNLNEGPNKQEGSHHLVSWTAKLVAYMRAESDIPRSKEISDLTGSGAITKEFLGIDNLEWWMGAMLELRYKALQALIEREAVEKGTTNILEMASGVLPRGIIMTERPEINYIETDLPDILEEKKSLISDLGIDMTKRHLALESLNALDGQRMKELTDSLPAGPVCFANEGLLMYLTLAEKEIVAKNIHAILKERGGLWITPDLSNSDRIRDIFVEYPELAPLLEKINKSTGRDMRANSIGDSAAIRKFFGDLGFELVEYNQTDLVTELSVIKNGPALNEKQSKLVKAMTSSSKVWVLRAI